MKRTNLYNGSSRSFESGAVWQEKLTGTTGTVYVKEYSTCRIRSVGANIISIDGITSISLLGGEIEYINAGPSSRADKTVAILVAGAGVFLQTSKESEDY